MLIDFNKPAKVDMGGGFDGGPEGGYIPQMAPSDAKKWRGKRFNAGKEGDRIEIRKSFPSCQILIFVAKDGWSYSEKNEHVDPKTQSYVDYNGNTKLRAVGESTRGKNVRISLNGPLKLSWEEYQEMTQVIEEAKNILGF